MDYKPIYPNTPDVYSNGGSSEPSAPPIQEPIQYQTIVMPLPQQSEYAYRQSIRRLNTDGRHFPVNASLFLLGLFFFPPLWIVSWCCWNSNDKYEKAWRKMNIFMSILFIIIMVILTIAFAIMGWEELEHRIPKEEDPSWRIPSILYLISFVLK